MQIEISIFPNGKEIVELDLTKIRSLSHREVFAKHRQGSITTTDGKDYVTDKATVNEVLKRLIANKYGGIYV